MTAIAKSLERSLVVVFLRKHTNLTQVADLIEAGAHEWSESELKAYCKAHGIMRKGDKR